MNKEIILIKKIIIIKKESIVDINENDDLKNI